MSGDAPPGRLYESDAFLCCPIKIFPYYARASPRFFPALSMAYTRLRRAYLFSDTYGRSKNPFLQDDADALISTDFRSFPLEEVRREFDIYGRESITEHMLRLIFELHDLTLQNGYMKTEVKEEFKKSHTGIFINAAPRISKVNGAPFYLAIGDGVRIVTTNPTGLSTVKHKIQSIHRLNNDKNPIYSPTEQFRSSYTAFLLHPDHNIDLIDEKVEDVIPDYPDDQWELSYVDRFGNMISYTKDVEKQWAAIEKAADNNGMVKIIIGNVSQNCYLGTSLRDIEPGALAIYKNKNIDIVRKWMEGEDSYTRLYRSSYLQFSKPDVGAKIKIAD